VQIFHLVSHELFGRLFHYEEWKQLYLFVSEQEKIKMPALACCFWSELTDSFPDAVQ